MQVIGQLLAVPKQQFTVALENVLWSVTLIEASGIMAATLVSGGAPVPIVTNKRCVCEQLIIPKNREVTGNFLFSTQNEELPWWESFGTTQLLLYASQAELAAIRNGN